MRKLFALLLLAASPAFGQQSDVANVTHLLSRATFGVRAADVTGVQQQGISKWIDAQLQPGRIPNDAVEARLQQFQTLSLSPVQLAEEYNPQKQQGQEKKMGMGPQRILADLVFAKLTRATLSDRQLEEVMTDFWFNHFNVFWGKGPVRYLVADYENTAIRPYVFGKFYDMLHATAQHPAMLLYLDNAMSNSRRGVNENYARELMELHTLGVDAGYTQQDVVAVARAFTGWTVQRRPELSFRFAPMLHDSEEKVVLGKKLRAGRGIEDGEDVLHMLAKDPHTAHFIAKKLVQRFVSDDAPQDFVDELANVFLKTDGDLKAVTRALFTSPKFYNAKYQHAKVKTPFELVTSALRTTMTRPQNPRELIQTLRTLGGLPYMAEAPTGYPSKSEDWVNSGAMLARMNFGIALAGSDASLAKALGSPEFQLK